VTDNVEFNAKVQWNLGLDFVTKQHKLLLSVSDMLTHVNFPTYVMADLHYGGPSVWPANTIFWHGDVFFLCCLCQGHSKTRSMTVSLKGKVFPYSLPSVGPGADPSEQAVSLQVT